MVEVFEHPYSTDIIVHIKGSTIERRHVYPDLKLKEGCHVVLDPTAIGLKRHIQNMTFSQDHSMMVISLMNKLAACTLNGLEQLFESSYII